MTTNRMKLGSLAMRNPHISTPFDRYNFHQIISMVPNQSHHAHPVDAIGRQHSRLSAASRLRQQLTS